jgi:pimeloyl-ACP methyl ester carboxylesterase
MPSLFIGGDRDPVISTNPMGIDMMKEALPDLRDVVLVPGAGHWTQQEAAAEVNAALLKFLAGL